MHLHGLTCSWISCQRKGFIEASKRWTHQSITARKTGDYKRKTHRHSEEWFSNWLEREERVFCVRARWDRVRRRLRLKRRCSIFSRGAIVSWLGGNGKKEDGLPNWAFWVNLSKVHNCSVMQMQIPHIDAPDPPYTHTYTHEHVQYIMYIFYSVYMCVCVSSSLTILFRPEPSASSWLELITLSWSLFRSWPYQFVIYCWLRYSVIIIPSDPQIRWPGTSVSFQPYLMRILRLHINNFTEEDCWRCVCVCVCVCLSVTHKHSYTEREKTNYFYVSETGLCVLFWPVVRGIWMFLTRSRFDAFNTCWEIPFRSMNVNLLVELEEELRDHMSHLDSSSGDHECQHTILWQSNGYWDVSVCTRMVDPPMLQASAMWYRSTCHYSLHGKMLFFKICPPGWHIIVFCSKSSSVPAKTFV